MEQSIHHFLKSLDSLDLGSLPLWLLALIGVLAIIGALVVLRNVIFGGRGGGSSSTVVMPPSERPHHKDYGYNIDASFRVPKGVYDFRMPSPEIKTDGLRQPLNVNLELAREMFVAKRSSDLESMMAQPSRPRSTVQPNWRLAQRLFVPRFGQKESEDVQEDT